MGKSEVVRILQNHPRQWFTAIKISRVIYTSKVSVSRSLGKLKLQGVVEERRNPEDTFKVQYRIKP